MLDYFKEAPKIHVLICAPELSALLDIYDDMLWVNELEVIDSQEFVGAANFAEDFYGFRKHAPSKLNVGKSNDGEAIGPLPGSFAVEAAAQCSAAFIASIRGDEKVPVLTRVRSNFLQPITPGRLTVNGDLAVARDRRIRINTLISQHKREVAIMSLDYAETLP